MQRVVYECRTPWRWRLPALACAVLMVVLSARAEVDYLLQAHFHERLVRAEAGDVGAQYHVGDMLLKGRGVRVDRPAAREWFGRAARSGMVKAKFKLAYMHLKGLGGEQDAGRALPLMREAAAAGYAPARFYLGEMYALGLGVQRDSAEAVKWIRASTQEGYRPPRRELELIRDAMGEAAPPPTAPASPQD